MSIKQFCFIILALELMYGICIGSAEFDWGGQYRARGVVQVNGLKNGTETYRPGPLETNNYGWEEHRLRLNADIIPHENIHIGVEVEAGTAVWGNNLNADSPVPFAVRQLYATFEDSPIKFKVGTFDFKLGEGWCLGEISNGLLINFNRGPWQYGLIYIRQYEGLIREYRMSINDDEDIYGGHLDRRINPEGTISIYALFDHIHKSPISVPILRYIEINDDGSSYIDHIGISKTNNLGPFTIKGEFNYGFGEIGGQINPHIPISSYAFYSRGEYLINSTHFSFTAGYGSGDDPDTEEKYEGFIAPHNSGYEGDDTNYLMGYTDFYEEDALSAGPSGGIENTTFITFAVDVVALPWKVYNSLTWLASSAEKEQIGYEYNLHTRYFWNERFETIIKVNRLWIVSDYFGSDVEGGGEVELSCQFTF